MRALSVGVKERVIRDFYKRERYDVMRPEYGVKFQKFGTRASVEFVDLFGWWRGI